MKRHVTRNKKPSDLSAMPVRTPGTIEPKGCDVVSPFGVIGTWHLLPMKYITTKLPDGTEEIFIFPKSVHHTDMAEAVCFLKDHPNDRAGWRRIHRKPISAGFVEGGKCVGNSESLMLASRAEDTNLLPCVGKEVSVWLNPGDTVVVTPGINQPPSAKSWWCDSHNRWATHTCTKGIHKDSPCCDPKLPGITLPCTVSLRECHNPVSFDLAQENGFPHHL